MKGEVFRMRRQQLSDSSGGSLVFRYKWRVPGQPGKWLRRQKTVELLSSLAADEFQQLLLGQLIKDFSTLSRKPKPHHPPEQLGFKQIANESRKSERNHQVP